MRCRSSWNAQEEILVLRSRFGAERKAAKRQSLGRTFWSRSFNRVKFGESFGSLKTSDGYADKMSRPLTSRLAAQSLLRPSQSTVSRCAFQTTRSLSQTTPKMDDGPPPRAPRKKIVRPSTASLLENIYGTSQTQAKPNAMASLSQSLVFQNANKTNVDTSALGGSYNQTLQKKEDDVEPFHFHIYSHKHNTHITCTKPNREPIISMSCGTIGFRKSRRGTFDSAYSLTKYVLERLIHAGWPMKMNRLEVVMRGFGQGRDASLKVLMSPEGKVLRDKIVRVADSTRVKFAGTRSEKPRRL